MYREDNQNIRYRLFHGEPIPLFWNGWRTNTHVLEREGWKFSSTEEFDRYANAHCVYLAATAPDGYVCISGRFYFRQNYGELYGLGMQQDFSNFLDAGIRMQQFTSKDVFRCSSMQEIKTWSMLEPVDLHANSYELKAPEYRLGDFKFFRRIEDLSPRDHDIFIPEKSVDRLFNEILKIQYPEQQEIKKKLILPAAQPIIQARVLSLAV